MKILCLCDSPTLTSGFARVAQNLFQCWRKRGVQIDCWGICFSGWEYKKVPYVNTIFPAGDGGVWCTAERLEMFLKQLSIGGYSHVWIMQDTFLLSATDFPAALQAVCREKNIKSMLYFPVDAPLDPEWCDIIAAVDVAVAYTKYGADEAYMKSAIRSQQLAATQKPTPLNFELSTLSYLPHGVDLEIYHPLPGRAALRHELYSQQPWLTGDDFVMINVNANQCRKDIPRSLEILAGLRARDIPAKLILHMSESGGPDQNISIENCARQLGLKRGEYGHHAMLFRGSMSILPETTDYTVKGNGSLVGFYNLADLCLTTTKGEGWGLAITEALACGTPVALPAHTSCQEISDMLKLHGLQDMRCLLPVEAGANVDRSDNTRMRRRVDLVGAVNALEAYYHSGVWKNRVSLGLNEALADWLSWDRIAGEMLRLFKGVVKAPAPAVMAPPPQVHGEFMQFEEMEVCQPSAN